MTTLHWLQAASGLGIFLFSLQILTQTLQSSMVERFQLILRRLTSTGTRSAITGFFAALLTQASSTAIIATMGFVDAAFIPLSQGFFMVLGAALGTTIKAWFFSISLLHLIPPLVLLSGGIAMLFLRAPTARRLLELLLSVMLVFIGLQFLSDGLSPFQEDPSFLKMLRSQSDVGTQAQSMAVLFGLLSTLLLQSSSASIFLTITLASQGSISFGVGAALILGANLGTTTIPLIASAAFQREGKRLALAHFFLKLFGVGITLLFFSYFLTVIDLLIPGEAKGTPLAFHLAAVHTGFNLISLTFWSLLSPLILWLVCWLLPDPAMDTVRTLSPAVWRILVSSPKRALQEAQEQTAQMRLLIKDLSDTCTELLRSPKNTETLSRLSPIRLTRRFEPIREGLYYLLLRCEPQQLDAEQRRFIQKQLRQIEAHSILFDEGIKLLAHLETNARASQNALPAEWFPLLDRFAKQLNDLWNSVLLSREEDAHTLRLQRSLNKLDEVNNKRWQNSPQDRHQDVVWRYQLLASLRRFAALLQSLNHPTASPPTELLATDLPSSPITTPPPAHAEE